MDENHQDKTENKQMATNGKSQLSLLSRQEIKKDQKDEKEAQKELDRLRKRLGKNEKGAFSTTRNWTGLKGKTLWDWLQLLGVLAIPLVVVLATIGFGWWQTQLAQQQHASDQQNQLDQQRQAILVAYLDNMNNLLLNKGLLTSKPGDEVRVIALTETLTAIRQLDGKRNSFLLQFLQDAQLIGVGSSNIVNFANADLSLTNLSGTNFCVHSGTTLSGANLSEAYSVHLGRANLSGANLSGAFLYGANLIFANLSRAHLSGAQTAGTDLSCANLSNADLSGASLLNTNLSNADLLNTNLSGASLSGASLSGANLSGANLSGVDLIGANFSGANLSGANLSKTDLIFAGHLTQQQLDQVYSCAGDTLPYWLTCHHN